MGIHWYCLMLGRTYPFHLPTANNLEEYERRTNPNLKIRGRTVLNYWKIARNELTLRTTTFEGTVGRRVQKRHLRALSAVGRMIFEPTKTRFRRKHSLF